MCDCNKNCGQQNCNSNCDKQTELYDMSQVQWDGPKINLPNSGIVINPCDNMVDVITLLANKIEELNTP